MRCTVFMAACLLCASAEALTPPTTDSCNGLKTEAMRKQCMSSVADAPPNITGKTYSTKDVVPSPQTYIDQSAPTVPIAPIVPYVNVLPSGQQGGVQRLP